MTKVNPNGRPLPAVTLEDARRQSEVAFAAKAAKLAAEWRECGADEAKIARGLERLREMAR